MSIAKTTVNGLPFANVAAAGVATANIEFGMAIERIQLILGGTTFTEAHMTNIKIRANGKPVVDLSGAQLKKLMAYRGVPQSTGFLDIDFTELTGRDLLDQILGSFDTSKGVSQLSMEVTIAGATAPTLSYRVTKSSPQRAGLAGQIQKLLRYPWQVATGGQLPIALPFGPVNGSVIKRIHITHGVADNVLDVQVKQNSAIVWEGTAAANVADQTAHGRVPQASMFTIDFTLDRNQRNAFDTRDASSLLLLPNFGAADSGDVLVEYYDKLGNL
jgi:hypothetical protein